MNRAKEREAETLNLAALKRKFVEWIASKPQKKLNILITGKTGVGKSRLVNALVGKYVAKEGDDKQSCTAVETPYVADIKGIEVVIWDSRGLQDGTDNDEDYLNSLKDKNLESGGFDIVIYCLKMDDTRCRRDDKDAIRMLTSGFGKDLWKKTVVALTFANRVAPADGGDEDAFFKKMFSSWKEEIDGLLTELQIDSQVRIDLKVVPTGNYLKSAQLRLPTSRNWLSDLWTDCFMVMSVTAGIALFHINKHRLRSRISASLAAAISPHSEEGTSQSADAGGDIPREIPLDEKQETSFFEKLFQAFVSVLKIAVVPVVTVIIKAWFGLL